VKKVFVLVEGQTEELFVNEVLQPALSGLMLIPVIVATKRVASGGTEPVNVNETPASRI